KGAGSRLLPFDQEGKWDSNFRRCERLPTPDPARRRLVKPVQRAAPVHERFVCMDWLFTKGRSVQPRSTVRGDKQMELSGTLDLCSGGYHLLHHSAAEDCYLSGSYYGNECIHSCRDHRL